MYDKRYGLKRLTDKGRKVGRAGWMDKCSFSLLLSSAAHCLLVYPDHAHFTLIGPMRADQRLYMQDKMNPHYFVRLEVTSVTLASQKDQVTCRRQA